MQKISNTTQERLFRHFDGILPRDTVLAIASMYVDAARRYHTLEQHILPMLDIISNNQPVNELQNSFKVACLYHDAICAFDETARHNEELSAALLNTAYAGFRSTTKSLLWPLPALLWFVAFTKEDLPAFDWSIAAVNPKSSWKSWKEAQRFRKIDRHGLYHGSSRFLLANERLIRAEYPYAPWPAYVQKRLAFLASYENANPSVAMHMAQLSKMEDEGEL